MRISTANQKAPIALGRRGEHLATRVQFPIAYYRSKFGDGTFELIARRSGDPAPYPVNITTDDNFVYWDVSNADTAVCGAGECEFLYYVGDTLAKSVIYGTVVSCSLDEVGDTPEPYQAWVDDVLSAGRSAQESARAAEQSAASMAFVSFSLDPTNGDLIMHNSELLGTTHFTLTEAGNLEVTI